VSDELDAIFERMAREEQDDADRQHGQFLLDVAAAQADRRQGRAEDPLLELLRRAQQAEVEKAEQEL
jgi:hypothetical protein